MPVNSEISGGKTPQRMKWIICNFVICPDVYIYIFWFP